MPAHEAYEMTGRLMECVYRKRRVYFTNKHHVEVDEAKLEKMEHLVNRECIEVLALPENYLTPRLMQEDIDPSEYLNYHALKYVNAGIDYKGKRLFVLQEVYDEIVCGAPPRAKLSEIKVVKEKNKRHRIQRNIDI